MMNRTGLMLAFVLLLLTVLCPCVLASRGNPGSCLLFPYVNTSAGNLTIITITNVQLDSIWLRFVWVDSEQCTPEDHWFSLTGEDTVTFLCSVFQGKSFEGFLYVYVVDGEGSEMERTDIETNVLVGQEFIISSWDNGATGCFSINPIIIQAIDPVSDGKLYLDGTEFSAAPRTLYFPRFFGQPDQGQVEMLKSKMVLINVTGGMFYTASADIHVYNDNENCFSTDYDFDCFEYEDLRLVSPATTADFLLSTSHAMNEPVGLTGIIEAGWLTIKSDFSMYHSFLIEHACLYGVLIESLGVLGFAADLPFHLEGAPTEYDRTMLWSTKPDGT